MAQVNAAVELACSVHEAETAWYDTSRWPEWVDQLARVVEVQGPWPQSGSTVVWESGPAGRGRVYEQVIEYERLYGQISEVEDDSIHARQQVVFEPAGDGAQIQLILDYRLKRRSPVSALVDLLFIRRLMSASLARTLSQFRAAAEAPRAGVE